MKKVLIVDDTKNIRLLLTKCLELEGFEVKSTKDGQEALEMFKSETFDLAFLDIKMPQLSGTELLTQIRAMGIQTPVVIITAYATIKNAVECTQMGAVAYLQKPFTSDRVRNTLKDMETKQNLSDIFTEVEECIIEKNLDRALELLKKKLAKDPLNKKVYKYLSTVSQLFGASEDAEKYLRLYRSFE